jgi:CrcB protein
MNILLIAAGGAIGAVLRYLTILASQQVFTGLKFPIGTFIANVFGCFLCGILYYFIIKNFSSFDIKYKNFLLVGVLGAYTTFSAFSLDFFRLFIASQYLQAFIYAISSVIMAILAMFFGFYLSKLIFA